MFLLKHAAAAVQGSEEVTVTGGPMIHNVTSSTNTTFSQNLGWEFQPLSEREVTHLGAYLLGSTIGQTVYLYRRSDGVELASVILDGADGWVETELGAPVTLDPAETYVVSIWDSGTLRAIRHDLTCGIDPGVTVISSGLSGTTAAMPTTSTAGTYTITGARFAAQPNTYRFYRWIITLNNGRSTINIAELKVYASGVEVATVGTGSWASSTFSSSFTSANAFDDDPATYWSSTSTFSYPVTIGIDIGSELATNITSYEMTARADASNGTPQDWTLEGSIDGDTWDLLHTASAETGWATGETRSYTL